MSLLGLWRLLGSLATAPGLPALVLRGRGEERRERLGEAPRSGPRPPVWLHAASVGEIVAAAPLVAAIRGRLALPIALSATTATGRERARTLAPDLGPFHAPLDAPRPVARALERLQPAAFVTLETELWPTLLDELGRRGVPWGVASGRLSVRGLARKRRVRGLYASILGRVTAIGARTAEDAERFVALGAPADRVTVTGDLKEDRTLPAWERPREDPPTWMAACTRPGEEEIVLAALTRVAGTWPHGELVLAPRHPERFEEVAAMCTRAGFVVRRWPERDTAPPPGWSVLLVDRMGVMDEAYRRASIAFVGGSLTPVGGHSPWEAAAAGRAVLTGPHVEHCRAAVDSLRVAGAAAEVHDAVELAAHVGALLRDPAQAARVGRMARETLAARTGAAAATVELFLARGLLR